LTSAADLHLQAKLSQACKAGIRAIEHPFSPIKMWGVIQAVLYSREQ